MSGKPDLLDCSAFIKVWITVIHTQRAQHFQERFKWLNNRHMVIESKWERWERKMFLLLPLAPWCPTLPLLIQMPTQIGLGTSLLWWYTFTVITYSLVFLPETHTNPCVYTDNTEPSSLRSSEASFILSLSSMHKNCWSCLDIFRALQPVLSCLREPILLPHKCCCGSLCSIW